jgi:hypothetical protein
MFEWLFSKLSSNQSRGHSRKHHKTSGNEHDRGNGNRNDGGYTSAHRKTVSNNKPQRPAHDARGGNTPTKPVHNHASTVPHRPRTGHTIRLDSPEDLRAMTWHVTNTIDQYNYQHNEQKMDLVILSGLFDMDLEWNKPHGNKIRFTCNNDTLWGVSLSPKIADALTQYVGSSYPKVKTWAPDKVLAKEVKRSLCQEASKERKYIFTKDYVRIMPAPLSWRICEALNSRKIGKAAQLLEEYISNHKERLAAEQKEKNVQYKRNRENIRILSYSGCEIPCSLAMVSINQILVWSEKYGFEHAYDNAYAVDEHYCQNNLDEGHKHKHRHLICTPRSGSVHNSSSHSKPGSSSNSKTRPQNQRKDSAVDLQPHKDSRKRSPSRGAESTSSRPRRDASSTRGAKSTHGAKSTDERQGRSGSGRYESVEGFAAGDRLVPTPALNPPSQAKNREIGSSRSPSRPPRPTDRQDRHTQPASVGHNRKPRDESRRRDRRVDSAHSGMDGAHSRVDSAHRAHSREASRPQKPTVSVDTASRVPSRQSREPSKERHYNESLAVPLGDYDSRDRSPRRKSPSGRSTRDRSPYSASSTTPQKVSRTVYPPGKEYMLEPSVDGNNVEISPLSPQGNEEFWANRPPDGYKGEVSP